MELSHDRHMEIVDLLASAANIGGTLTDAAVDELLARGRVTEGELDTVLASLQWGGFLIPQGFGLMSLTMPSNWLG